VALLQVDFSDAIAGNSTLAGDNPHDISDLHSIPRADCHKEPDHSGSGAGSGARPLTIGRPGLRSGGLMRFGLSALGTLAFQYIERGSSKLRPVEFLEQWLERDDLASGESAREDGTQLLAYCFLAIVRAPLGAVEIERGESSAR
jgi:hypothetical protein